MAAFPSPGLPARFRRVLCGVALAAGLAGCGGFSPPALPPPSIQSFQAAPPVVTAGGSAALTGVFPRGTGAVDPAVGPVASGVAVSVAPAATTTYTLTVTVPGQPPAVATTTVQVVPAPQKPVITVLDPVTAGATARASVPDQPGCTFSWALDGDGIDAGGGIDTGGDTPGITFTAAEFGKQLLTCTVTSAAGLAVTSDPVTFLLGGPTILTFSASPDPVTAGAQTTLAFTFSGGAGSLDPGGQAVTSGIPLTVTVPADPGRAGFTLTVTDGTFTSAETCFATVVPLPTITRFAAAPPILGPDAATDLTAVFDAGPGGTASVDPGVGPVASGAPVSTGALGATTTFTLTVTNAAGTPVRATLEVLVGSLAPFAGAPSGAGSVDGNGEDAGFLYPAGVVQLPDGSLLVADTGNHTLRRVTLDGTATTVAGAEGMPGSADGPGLQARFNRPTSLVLDAPTGQVYLADTGNHTIRRVAPDFSVTTVAGTPELPGYGNGPALVASFDQPQGLALFRSDQALTVFVADTGNDLLRFLQISPGLPAMVGTVAGAPGQSGYVDGLLGSAARFAGPAGLAWDGLLTRSLLAADTGNNALRQVILQGTSGMPGTLAGAGPGGPVPAGTPGSTDAPARFQAPTALVSAPVLLGGQFQLFLLDTGNSTLRQVVTDGTAANTQVATLAGSALEPPGSQDGPGSQARLYQPQGLALASDGGLVIADTGNSQIRRATLGPVTLGPLCGQAGHPGSADGPGPVAQMRRPQGTALDAAGNLYVADAGNDTLRKVAPDGTVTTVAGIPLQAGIQAPDGRALFASPRGVAVAPSGALYVADTGNDAIRRIDPGGAVTTLTGSGLAQPTAVVLDAAGTLYVADTGHNLVRRIPPNGSLGTLAGSPDGALGVNVTFNAPQGLALSPDGRTLYVADTGDHVVWALRLVEGRADLLAGAPGIPGSADGPGSAARLDSPTALAVDAAGNVYVANTGSSTVSRITPAGEVFTFLGDPARSALVFGPLPARVVAPRGLAVDPATGNLLLTVDDAVLRVDFRP